MNKSYVLKRSWKIDAEKVCEDKQTGFLQVHKGCFDINCDDKIYYMTKDGEKRSVDFDYAGDFYEGLAAVGIRGKGFGYINTDFDIVIELKYDNANDFKNGVARVEHNGNVEFIDRNGKAIFDPDIIKCKYQEICEFNEGLCRVSTMNINEISLVQRSKHSAYAGVWGFIDEKGEEIVKPEYVYAYDFSNGIALVAKGKWVFDRDYFAFRTDCTLWGAIDTNGNEVIPFVFDEIVPSCADKNIFTVHYGGWENGKWGVIDSRGNWLAKPVFEDIDSVYDGLVVFYECDRNCDNIDDILLGIYDIKQQKVIFEPQFIKVSFEENGDLNIRFFDEKLGRTVGKIIDRCGKERFESEYTFISTWTYPYQVVIRDQNTERRGLIDNEGNEILPCLDGVAINGIHYEQRRIVFERNRKKYLGDFEGNEITEPVYNSISGFEHPLLTVSISEKGIKKEGLIDYNGKVVLEPIYRYIYWLNDNSGVIVFTEKDCEFYELINA